MMKVNISGNKGMINQLNHHQTQTRIIQNLIPNIYGVVGGMLNQLLSRVHEIRIELNKSVKWATVLVIAFNQLVESISNMTRSFNQLVEKHFLSGIALNQLVERFKVLSFGLNQLVESTANMTQSFNQLVEKHFLKGIALNQLVKCDEQQKVILNYHFNSKSSINPKIN